MKVKVFEILHAIHEVAPLKLQESYDNAGLLVGTHDQLIERALICVDVTEAVVEEALEKKCEMIISHHPIIFKGLKNLVPNGPVERIVLMAVRNNLAIAAVHTNIDNVIDGVNAMIARRLGLGRLQVLRPLPNQLRKLVTFCPTGHADKVRQAMFDAGAGKIGNYDSCSYNLDGFGTFRGGEGTNPFVGNKNQLHSEAEQRIETIVPIYNVRKVIDAMLQAHPYEEVAYDIYPIENTFNSIGAGQIGYLEVPLTQNEFLDLVKTRFNCKLLRHSKVLESSIQKVAVCGGSGAFLINDAKALQADAFLTADLKYHDFFEADNKLLVIDAGHFETEQFTKELIAGIIQEKIPNFAPLISEVNTNSVHYFF
jgi:dinuclear metal center YbgI/SA1388 family protein